MQDYIENRVLDIAYYIINNCSTVRKAATIFKISKSTVHKDMTERLPQLNESLYKEVRNILDINKAQRHLRGGLATKEKYLHKSK